MQGSKGDTNIQNRLLDSVEARDGGMIRENSIGTCTLPYVKSMTSLSLVLEAGGPKPVLWESLEGWGGSGWRGHTYAHD